MPLFINSSHLIFNLRETLFFHYFFLYFVFLRQVDVHTSYFKLFYMTLQLRLVISVIKLEIVVVVLQSVGFLLSL